MMSFPVNTVFPSYNNTANFSGENTVVRSAGLVSNPEQAEAVASAQREGRLGLSQFGFLKIPREVLFLQDERGAKIKSTSVSSATKSDMDEERLLQKVEDPHNAVQGLNTDEDQSRERDVTDDKPKNDDTPHPAPDAPVEASVLGTGSDVYQGVISANHASLSGRNLSVLA